MTKKIFQSVFLAASSILVACLAIFIGVLYNYFSSVQSDQLKCDMTLTAAAVEAEGINYLKNLDPGNIRLTWVSNDGTVLFDTETDASSMENHAEREEIKEALAYGNGESSRYSKTLTVQTQYCAKKLSDGTVLRVSATHLTIPALLLGMLQPILLILIFAIALSAILAKKLSQRIVEPFNNLDLEKPLENNTYDELSPLLTHIELQRRQIKHQLTELKNRQNEFNAVTQDMNEGLVLLSSKHKILSMNPSAAAFFNTTVYCVGEDFVTIDRSREIDKAIKTAQAKEHTEIQQTRNGREFQLNVSRIDTDGKPSGIILLIFDVTEKLFAERNRREFTANVSHELKTPLQSIMGSAELLENGLVRSEDIPHFVGNIRSEASRLVILIDDIIRLSQLDEQGDLPIEQVDLYSMAEKEIGSLKQVADAREVSLSLQGDSVVIPSVPQLIHEILYNLCENAIKYNIPGGSVTVTIKSGQNGASITVADTGIGIPIEHQSRVFERFYRVDKSHSKATGGTGLGLSIVKHAVQYLNGTILMQSEPKKGTSITIMFPKVH